MADEWGEGGLGLAEGRGQPVGGGGAPPPRKAIELSAKVRESFHIIWRGAAY